jgi:hypothetical protein
LFLSVLAAGVIAGSLATTSRGGESPGSSPEVAPALLRREILDLSASLLRAEAVAEELAEEEAILGVSTGANDPAGSNALRAWRELWELSIGKLDEPLTAVRIDDAVRSMQKNETAALADWRSAMGKLLEAQDTDRDGNPAVEPTRPAEGTNAALSPSLIALGVLAMLAGWVLALREARGEIRKWLRILGSRPSLFVAALVLPLASPEHALAVPERDDAAIGSAPARPPGRPSAELVRRRDEVRQHLLEITRSNDLALGRITLRLAEVRRARAAHVLRPGNPWERAIANPAGGVESDAQEQFRAIRVSALVVARADRETGRIQMELARAARPPDRPATGRADATLRNALVRVAACVLFAVAALTPLMSVLRRRNIRLRRERRRCLRCLNMDTLEVVEPAEMDQERVPRDPLVACAACGYEIRGSYLAQNRLCSATVGIKASGKTLWMMVLYDLITRFRADLPAAAEMRKIPSREDERFDQLVRGILYERSASGPPPTFPGLPYPLNLYVRDADPFGRNTTMVNLFDFAGELTNSSVYGNNELNEFRRRALLCEGFTLFLDPTQVTPGHGGSIEDQVDTLSWFTEDLHAMHGVPAEQPLHLPVAVCISKFDLLITQSLMGGQAYELVAELRSTLDALPDLALIDHRSQLCARVLPLMFPGWNLEDTLRRHFGQRYMFFPMSSVGLESDELGVEDLAKRTFVPFGVLEPLLWLLHMNGYRKLG